MKKKIFFNPVAPDSDDSLNVSIVWGLLAVRRNFRKLGYYMRVSEYSKQIREYVQFVRKNK